MSQTKIQILLGVRHENVQESFKNFETEPDMAHYFNTTVL